MKNRVLLIEDDDGFVNAVKLMLRDHPVDVVRSATGAEGIQKYREMPYAFATAIIDYCLPDQVGSEIARHIRKLNPDQDILFASGYQNPEYLIDLLETGGARSFICKDRPTNEIRSRILDSISIYQNKNRVVGLDDYSQSKAEIELKAAGIIGRSQVMCAVLKQINKYISSPLSVLLVGETGTGKELIAKALVPPGKKLVTVDCTKFAQNEQLLESDLFGYVQGAFTGATRDKPGLMVQAQDQVLFLDELHTLSIVAQTKLLRFLQEMRYRRVGDHTGREISINFKLIAATKPDILDRVRDGRFLEDLYHRVAKLEIRIPPLRDRAEDIEPLVRHFQEQFNQGKPSDEHKQIRISTINELKKLLWSGNVRQLDNVVQRLLTDAQGDIVNPTDLDAYLKTQGELVSNGSVPGGTLDESTQRFETDKIIGALKRCRTQTEAAAKLGISRWNLNRKLARFEINPEAYLLST